MSLSSFHDPTLAWASCGNLSSPSACGPTLKVFSMHEGEPKHRTMSPHSGNPVEPPGACKRLQKLLTIPPTGQAAWHDTLEPSMISQLSGHLCLEERGHICSESLGSVRATGSRR